mgnify:CR=1 FL=1
MTKMFSRRRVRVAGRRLGILMELCAIMEWSKTHVHSTLHICWGAQAGLYYHYGIPKRALPQKRASLMSGLLIAASGAHAPLDVPDVVGHGLIHAVVQPVLRRCQA